MKKAENHICCPKCGWEPDGQAHWQCLCGHSFDAFASAGRCPACFRQWERTHCVPEAGGCNGKTNHLDWYGDLQGWLQRELQALPIFTPFKKRKKHDPE
jgi:hypothetical protein